MRHNLQKSIEIVGVSDLGCNRTNNEDCITWDSNIGLAILADGMGGAKAGEVAGRIATETVRKSVIEAFDVNSGGLELKEAGSNFLRGTLMLNKAIHEANDVILRVADDQPECSGMGSTLTSALFHDNKISIAHVGDSRIYRLRGLEFQQLTEDHTIIQEMVNGGLYSRQQAEEEVNKNILTRAVGVTTHLKIDLLEHLVRPNDTFLMCSDGLTDMVSDDEIHENLLNTKDLRESADILINLAKEHGGSDNISVILIQIRKPFPAKSNIARKIKNWFT